MSIDMQHYDSGNVFSKILAGDIPNDTVYENEHVLAFNDISKAAPVHVLVIPKGAYISFSDFMSKANGDAVAAFFASVHHVASEVLGLDEDGYRLVTNHGTNGSQTVGHFHVHILGGRQLGGLVPDDYLVR